MTPPLHPALSYFVLKDCSATWRLNNPAIAFYELVFFLKGEAEYYIDGARYHIEAGSVLFLRPGSSRLATTPGMSCAALDFHLPPGETLLLPTVTRLSSALWEELTRYLQEINYEWVSQRPGTALRCTAFLLLVLHGLLYQPALRLQNPHVERIKRTVVKHYGEKLTVNGLSEYCGLHPAYAGALFKKVEGCSILAYIQQVRVNKAAVLLDTGEYSVGEVALLTGFSDVYYFSTVFKKCTGHPPTLHRRR